MKIKYFAWVAEIIDKREEEIKVPDHVTDVNTLINFLCTKDESYEAAFANRKQIKFAINQKLSRSNAKITNNDEVAFFPPMTGG
ncbi:MAG: molybdopterin converting factor subunit 1 [Hyphomicrobiales bacterium]|jgi:molybdopterin synthase sulfur carrier subunit|nr:molybdopterin converting factor subunit 1 [Alphaproteobacteria bacterium]